MKFLQKSAMWLFTAAIAVMGGLTSCSSDDSEPQNVSRLEQTVSGMQGMVSLDPSTLGDWDEGYVCADGYVLAKGLTSEAEMHKAMSRAGKDVEDTPCISYMPADGSLVVHVFFAEDGLPSQIVAGGATLMFNFLSDTVLELVLSTDTDYSYQTTVTYDREALLQAISNRDFTFFFQTRLAAIVELLRNAAIPEQFASIVSSFSSICDRVLAEDPEATLEDLVNSGLVDESGKATFVDNVTESFKDVVVTVHYAIALWTGKASFKVGGTSCTLSGTIHCASEDFNTYGTYGIVCDTDPAKLFTENAEYSGTGYQEGISTHFDVDFRGLKANTTYYYRAYYAFNTSDHGSLSFKYGDPDAEIAYDSVIKEFTTGDNILTVDVVMCIDVTGSMSGIINTVKDNAMSFYDAFNQKCVDNGIELSGLNNTVIAFQDKNVDGDRWWMQSEKYQLPEQRDLFDAFVSDLYADGGGDAPESGLEALDGAFDLLTDAIDDGYHRQVVILWTDAPFLKTSDYTDLNVEDLEKKWNTLSSGRRLILFAPSYDYGSNGGNWAELDGWKNLIHSTEIQSSFYDFDYVLDNIIGELIGRGSSAAPARASRPGTPIVVRPN